MKHIFLDTNEVIDFLADRRPFSLEAAKLFDFGIEGAAKIYIAAASYNNIYYIIRQSLTHKATINLLDELSEITVIVDVTDAIIRKSLKTDFSDYEDAIQYHCALSVPEINFIVTRNVKDFRKSTLSVLSPSEAIVAIQLS